MDVEFAVLTVLASYPLRFGHQSGPPTGHASGCVVQYGSRRLLLTVAHAVAPDEEWAVELRYEGSQGTRVWKLGRMQYMVAVDATGVHDVDFAFAEVPEDLKSYWQRFSDTGIAIAEQERIVLASDLRAAPTRDKHYGFAGLTMHTSEPRPPSLPHGISGAELRVEQSLTYRDTHDGLDRYDLGHPHPGDKYYKGCSGAPLLSDDGDLVGLVVSGSVSDSTIHALPLRQYAGAVDAALSSG